MSKKSENFVEPIKEFLLEGDKISNINKILKQIDIEDYKLRLCEKIDPNLLGSLETKTSVNFDLDTFVFFKEKKVSFSNLNEINLFLVASGKEKNNKLTTNDLIAFCQDKMKQWPNCEYGIVFKDNDVVIIKKVFFNQVITFIQLNK